MAETEDGAKLRPELRTALEDVAEALDLGSGDTELVARFTDGRLRWYSKTHLRVPASKLDELTRGAGAGTLAE